VKGVAAGEPSVWLTAQESVRLQLNVGSTTVAVTSLSAHLTTGITSLALTRSALSASDSTFNVSHALEQRLDSEGDSGPLHAFATTSADSTLLPLSPNELTV